MRDYAPALGAAGISYNAFRELDYFCRQYPEKKRRAAALLRLCAARLDHQPRAREPGDPTFRSVAAREALEKDIALIEDTARAVCPQCPGQLVRHVTEKLPISALNPACGRRAFCQARSAFYVQLYHRRWAG